MRSWSLQVLKDLPVLKGEHMHKNLCVVNSVLNLIKYQNDDQPLNKKCEPVYPGLLPPKFPEWIYSADHLVLIKAYKQLLNLLPSRLVKMAFTNSLNKDFLSSLLNYLEGKLKKIFFNSYLDLIFHQPIKK